MVTKTSAEAQNKFGELLDLVQREPVAITRHGRTAAYIVSPRDMKDLVSLNAKRKGAADEFRAWSEKFKDHISPEAQSLTDEDINRMVHELR